MYSNRMTGSIILSAVYGYETSPRNDSLVNIVESAIGRLSVAALPNSKASSRINLNTICTNYP